MKRSTLCFATFFFCAAFCSLGAARQERVHLLPKLRAGDVVSYRIRFRTEKIVATQSNVTSPAAPAPAEIDLAAVFRTEILDVQDSGGSAMLRARTEFQAPNGGAAAGDAPGKNVEYTIRPDGQLADVRGYDALSLEEQQAWADWISIFAMTATFPEQGLRRGEKWEFAEEEKSGTPIAGLVWHKRSEYVQDEPCGGTPLGDENAVSSTAQRDETCAVILTTATLKQNSSRKDATSEDFRLHDLRTVGSAHGKNQVVAYISLKTGMLVRATEEGSQSMDVTVEKTDGSSRVRYKVDAKSNSELLLVVDAAASRAN